MFLLDLNQKDELFQYLEDQNWLLNNEKIESLTIPGAGNMNYVLRVTTSIRTFILKQSRGYVEKYPQIEAPINRVEVEVNFYKKIKDNKIITGYMPDILHVDLENFIVQMEDLGIGTDFSFLYGNKNKLSMVEVSELVSYLQQLHTQFVDNMPPVIFENLEMRKLNHEHIFVYPFLVDNGFDLNQVENGLQEIALKYKHDVALKERISTLGELYLQNGSELLHGDFYPGSWLKTSDGLKIIDPEFCFYGFLEFDLAVFLAHLHITQHNQDIIDAVYQNYASNRAIQHELLENFIGIEIMRRLIGLAQLPLKNIDLLQREKLLDYGYQLIMNKK